MEGVDAEELTRKSGPQAERATSTSISDPGGDVVLVLETQWTSVAPKSVAIRGHLSAACSASDSSLLLSDSLLVRSWCEFKRMHTRSPARGRI